MTLLVSYLEKGPIQGVLRGRGNVAMQGFDPNLTLTDVRADALDLPTVELRISPAKGKAMTVSLGLAPIEIGSDPDCDVVLDDPLVSRRHCRVFRNAQGVVLADCDSKNGVYVERVRVREVYLDPKAVITVGSSKIRLEPSKKVTTVQLSRAAKFGEAIGQSYTMRALFAELQAAASTSETVLLLGESGTGKELLARGIHDQSPRAKGPFTIFDCSAVAPSLVEAELFGYVKGAFTGAVNDHPGVFEEAHGGTLFIDELGELPLELQPKLLRALESRQVRRLGSSNWTSVDVRVVAATHRDLRARIAAGQFRMDLFYRLAVVETFVPALRERREDIPLLVERFLGEKAPPRTLADLPANTLSMLAKHDWPGNVRELRNTVTRVLLFPEVTTLPLGLRQGPVGQLPDVLHLPLREAREHVVEHFERHYLQTHLAQHHGSIPRAAEHIGVSRQFLHRILERHGISSEKDRGR